MTKIIIFYDNFGAIANSKKSEAQNDTKNIEKYHITRDIMQRLDIEVVKIASEENLIDHFTKVLLDMTFEHYVERFEVRVRFIED